MKKAVITGATSMIGIALIEECIKNGIEVLAIIRRKSPHRERLPKSPYLKIRECSLDELNQCEEAGEDTYDVFYHLAWEYTSKVSRDNPLLQEKNIKNTLEAVELAKRFGCRKFIGAGSQAEYGSVKGIISPETPVSPQIAYGMAKYAAGRLSEKLCSQYGITHIWGRVFSVYGKYDNAGTMLSYALERFRKREAAEFSSATQLWDYLYEEDAGKIFYLLGSKVEKNGVYCIASGTSRPLKEFILELKELTGAASACSFAPETDGSGTISLQADISRLIKDTGYVPETAFKEGIAKVLASYPC